MNIMQHIKDFFADAKKRNIFISCAAAVVIIAVAVPVGLALYGNNTSPVSSVTSSREKIDGVSSNASASQGSGASSEKNSSSKPGKENSSDKPVPAIKRITVPVLLQKLRGNPLKAELVPLPQNRGFLPLPLIPAVPVRLPMAPAAGEPVEVMAAVLPATAAGISR